MANGPRMPYSNILLAASLLHMYGHTYKAEVGSANVEVYAFVHTSGLHVSCHGLGVPLLIGRMLHQSSQSLWYLSEGLSHVG